MTTALKNRRSAPASRQADRVPFFKREDWTLFRQVESLCQRAGVPPERLLRLVLKELTDNALDAPGRARVTVGRLDAGGFFVEDDGDGIDGSPADVAELFSVSRPMMSSKLLRLPVRGALGNGTRVIAGAVLATDGELRVGTRGQWLRLQTQELDGRTVAEVVGERAQRGTRVEIRLGACLDADPQPLAWAQRAVALAQGGVHYKGWKTSAWWYDSDAWFELLQAGGTLTVREFVESLAGCSGPKACAIAADFKQRMIASISRAEAEQLLEIARSFAPAVRAGRLGRVGERPELGAYARMETSFEVVPARGSVTAQVPAVVEAWVQRASTRSFELHVNRTPVAAEMEVQRADEAASSAVFGCGLRHVFRSGKHPLRIMVNVIAPHVPLTSDGKAPNLERIADDVMMVLEKAARKCKGAAVGGVPAHSQKRVVLDSIPAAVAKSSGDDHYRYSQRQLFYVVRPFVQEATGAELDYDHFTGILNDYEQEHGELAGLTRDPRGVLYHPHLQQEIPIGTLAVERYQRPEWTFSRLLYVEKEGFFRALRDVHWPERHDCALLTSKGFSSRAARDLLDLLADDNEPVTVFATHDADGSGTLIYQSLQEGTATRPLRRRVEIVNLGLEPEEAIEMGLKVEDIKPKRKVASADYVAPQWKAWFQHHRVELNEMSTPAFLEWLDRKMAAQGQGKLVPPAGPLHERFRTTVRERVEQREVAHALAQAGIDDRVERSLARLEPAVKRCLATLETTVRRALRKHPAAQWTAPVEEIATAVIDSDETGRA